MRVQILRNRAHGFVFRVSCIGFRISDFGSRVQDVGFWVWSLGLTFPHWLGGSPGARRGFLLEQSVFFEAMNLKHRLPDSGELPYKSRGSENGALTSYKKTIN